MTTTITAGYDECIEAARLALGRGDRSAAERSLRAAVRAAEQLENAHQHLAAALVRLGELRRETPGDDEADALFTRAIDHGERAWGPDHLALLPALTGLGAVRVARGAADSAEPVLARALAIGERGLGPEHPDLVVLLNDLSRLYLRRAAHASAEPLLLRLHAIKRVKGEDHPEVATVLASLAAVRQALGRYDAAEQLWRRVLEIRERTLAPNHFAVATALEHLADTCAARGKLEEALRLFQRALAMRELTLDPGHPSLRIARERIADLQLQAAEEGGDRDGGVPASYAPPSYTPAYTTPAAPAPLVHTPAASVPAVPAPAVPTPAASAPLAVPMAPLAPMAAVTPPEPLPLPLPAAPQPLAEPAPTALAERPASASWALATLAPAGGIMIPDDGASASGGAARATVLIPGPGGGFTLESVEMPLDPPLAPADRVRRAIVAAVALLRAYPKRAAVAGTGTAALVVAGLLAGRPAAGELPPLESTAWAATSVPASPASPSPDGSRAAMVTEAAAAAGVALAADSLAARPAATPAPAPAASATSSTSAAAARAAAPRPAERAESRPVDTATLPVLRAAPGVGDLGITVANPLAATNTAAALARGALAPARASEAESAAPGTRAPRLLGAAPAAEYPVLLRQRRVEGTVRVEFIVDTLGRPDLATLKVLHTPHDQFTEAVRRVIPQLRFAPAVVGGRKERAPVRMPFEFALN